jgi:quinol monooxygenase YgiN
MVIRHHVGDYDAWLKAYTSAAQLQKSGGVLEESIHQDAKDPNEVLVLHRFANPAAAEAFANNHALAEAMKSGGVDRPPRVEIYEEAKR